MANEFMDQSIEKYRQELMAYSRRNPRFLSEEHAEYEKANEKEERISLSDKPHQDDSLESMFAGITKEMRIQNVCKKENMDCSENEMESDTDLVNPKIIAEQDNEQEKAYEKEGEAYPPYNNGIITEFDSKEAFMNANLTTGFLRVQVSAAGQAFPVQNAKVVISKSFRGSEFVFYTAQTDASGIMTRISLPTPDRDLSDTPSGLQPYSTYDIAVEHPGFIRMYLRNCAIFEGIETIQRIDLIPSSDGAYGILEFTNEEGGIYGA